MSRMKISKSSQKKRKKQGCRKKVELQSPQSISTRMMGITKKMEKLQSTEMFASRTKHGNDNN